MDCSHTGSRTSITCSIKQGAICENDILQNIIFSSHNYNIKGTQTLAKQFMEKLREKREERVK